MAYDITSPLVIGISSRALFDLEAENRIYEEEGLEIWGKPLADGSIAAGIFNSGENPVILRPATYLKKAGWAVEGPCRDLWRQRECPKETGIPPHGVLFLKFNAKQQ